MYSKISASDRIRIGNLEAKLGKRTLRQILTPEGNRLMRPERFSNLLAGTGKLTPSELENLNLASRNQQQLSGLKTRGDKLGKRDFRVNRALRDWLQYGKQKGSPNSDNSQRAIRALRFLGIDPNDGTFYVTKRSF